MAKPAVSRVDGGDKNPRLWLQDEGVFGRSRNVGWRPVPEDSAAAADRRAAQIQHDYVLKARARMREIGELRGRRLTIREISAHESFPFSYDMVSKAFRGVSQLSLSLVAAVFTTLEKIDAQGRSASLRPTPPGSPGPPS